jgi:hypothetical protein
MPSLLTRDKIMYKNRHLRPSTVAIRSRILWTRKLAGQGPKPDPKSRIFDQIETRYIIPGELQQRVQEWRSPGLTRQRGGDGAATAADTRVEQPDNNAEALRYDFALAATRQRRTPVNAAKTTTVRSAQPSEQAHNKWLVRRATTPDC